MKNFLMETCLLESFDNPLVPAVSLTDGWVWWRPSTSSPPAGDVSSVQPLLVVFTPAMHTPASSEHRLLLYINSKVTRSNFRHFRCRSCKLPNATTCCRLHVGDNTEGDLSALTRSTALPSQHISEVWNTASLVLGMLVLPLLLLRLLLLCLRQLLCLLLLLLLLDVSHSALLRDVSGV